MRNLLLEYEEILDKLPGWIREIISQLWQNYEWGAFTPIDTLPFGVEGYISKVQADLWPACRYPAVAIMELPPEHPDSTVMVILCDREDIYVYAPSGAIVHRRDIALTWRRCHQVACRMNVMRPIERSADLEVRSI